MSTKKYLVILNNYKDLAGRSKLGVKKRVDNIIDLYNDRKIYNFKTVKAVLDKLTGSTRKVVDVGIKQYNEVLNKYKEAEPLPVRRKRVKEEKIHKKKKTLR